MDLDRFCYFELLNCVKELGYDPDKCTIYVKFVDSVVLVEIKCDRDTTRVTACLGDGDILEAFVCHMVEEPLVVPPLLEYVTHVEEESDVSFDKVIGQDFGGSGVPSFDAFDADLEPFNEPPFEPTQNTAPLQPNSPSSVPCTPPTVDNTESNLASNTTAAASNPAPNTTTEPNPAPNTTAAASNPAPTFSETGSDLDSYLDGLFDEGEVHSESDVDEELRGFREEERAGKRKRRKRGERAPVPEHVKLGSGPKGPDVGYDESEGANRDTMEGKLAGDEPYYPSDEAASFETDPDDISDDDEGVVEQRVKAKRRKLTNRVVFDKTSKKIVWETGLQFESVNEFRTAVTKYAVHEHVAIEKCINEPTRVRVRCVEGCPWLLFASLDSRTNNFVVKNYNPIHKCDPTNRNKLCNTKFLSSHYNERIKEPPNIRIFELQQLIKKELDLYVGRTVCRRARNKVLAEFRGDHVLEFGRILDYRDELLRLNPGSTCVVRLSDETFEGGKNCLEDSTYVLMQ